MPIVRRAIAIDTASGDGTGFRDEQLYKKWPNVHDWLTLAKFEDGSSRTPGKIAFKVQGGGICGTIQDEDAHQSAYVTGSSFFEALDAMESAINSSETRWITWPSHRAKKGQK